VRLGKELLGASGLEIGWEVLVGVSPFVRADDPDLFAAQPLAERLEDARFVDVADHPGLLARADAGQQVDAEDSSAEQVFGVYLCGPEGRAEGSGGGGRGGGGELEEPRTTERLYPAARSATPSAASDRDVRRGSHHIHPHTGNQPLSSFDRAGVLR
jgi:hypothetical protein